MAIALDLVRATLTAAATLGLVTVGAPSTSAQAPCAEVVLRSELYPATGPLLRTPLGAPVIGGDFALQVERALPKSRGLLTFEFPGDKVPGAPSFRPLFLLLPSPSSFFGTNANGESALLLHQPSVSSSLCGLKVNFQAFLFDPSVVGGLAPTNEVELGLGASNAPPFPLSSSYPKNLFLADTVFEIGDVDGDGFDDVVAVRDTFPLSLNVWLGSETGPVNAGSVEVSSDPVSIVTPRFHDLDLADLDANGDLDAVIARPDHDDVLVCMGDGAGGFASGVAFAVGVAPTDVSVGRIDGDAFLDILAANSQEATVSVLLGDGAGSFGTASHFLVDAARTGGEIFRAAMGDVDGDGDTDVVATAFQGDMVSVLLGDGTGALGAPTSYSTGRAPHRIELGDFDGDLDLDMAYVQTNVSTSVSTLQVRLGNGDGTFGPESSRGFIDRWTFDVADMDADGDDEIVYEVEESGVMIDDVRLDGTFVQRSFLRPSATGLPRVGDLNGDGVQDVFDQAFLPGDEPGTLRLTEMIQDVHNTLVFSFDLDEDGFTDILSTNPSFQVVVRHGSGRGDGRFEPAEVLLGGLLAEVADFDSDGIDDLVVHNGAGFEVRLGLGNESFGSSIPVTTTGPIDWLTVADLNDDGRPDLVTLDAGPFASRFGTLLGNGDGSFGPHQLTTGPNQVGGAAVGFLDEDDFPDLVFGEFGGSPRLVRARLGNGDGTFGSAFDIASLFFAEWLYSIHVVDLNGDGRGDVVAGERVMIQDSGGGFGNLTYGLGNRAKSIVADVDGDSRLDILSWDAVVGDQLYFSRGFGDGTFAPRKSHPTWAPLSVQTGNPNTSWTKTLRPTDLDGDGVLDVLNPLGSFALPMLNLLGE